MTNIGKSKTSYTILIFLLWVLHTRWYWKHQTSRRLLKLTGEVSLYYTFFDRLTFAHRSGAATNTLIQHIQSMVEVFIISLTI